MLLSSAFRRRAVGLPIRTLTLNAEGSTVGNLPERGSGTVPAGLSAYPDEPALKEERTPAGLTAGGDEKVTYILIPSG